MAEVRMVVTSYEGAVYVHRSLMHSAKVLLRAAQSDERGSYHNALAATTFAWLAFEAWLNTLIEHLDPNVYAREREFFTRREGYPGPLGKVKWIVEQLGAEPDAEVAATHAVIGDLYDLRNEFVHAKPARYSGSLEHPADVEPPTMESQWIESRVGVPEAERYVSAVTRYSEWLHAHL